MENLPYLITRPLDQEKILVIHKHTLFMMMGPAPQAPTLVFIQSLGLAANADQALGESLEPLGLAANADQALKYITTLNSKYLLDVA